MLSERGRIEMKINFLRFENFRGQTTEYDFKNKTNVVLYKNSKGKTTLLKALRYAFVGEGDGGTVDVVFTVDNQTYAIKRENKTVYIEGRKTTQKNLEKFIENITGCNKEALKFLMSATSALEEFNPKKFAEFLYNCGFIEFTITIDKLISFCKNISPETENSVREYFESNNISSITEATIEEANVYFTNKKKEKKAVVDKLKKSLADLCNVEMPTKSEADAISDYDTANAMLINGELYRNLDTLYNKSIISQKTYEEEIELLKKKINYAENHLNGFLPDIKKEDNLKAAKERLISDLKICSLNEKESIVNQLEEVITELEAYQIKYLNYSLKTSLKDAMDIVRRLQPIEVAPLNAPILDESDLYFQKLASETVKKDWEEYKKKEKIEKELEAEQEELKKLNNLVSIFEEGSGVRQQALSLILKSLSDSINENSVKIGTNLNVTFEPLTEGGIEVRFNDIPYKDLSQSEKRVVETLVFDLVANLCGLNVLLCDNFDCLDNERFKDTLNLLTSDEVSERYDTIIVTAVNHSDLIDEAEVLEK